MPWFKVDDTLPTNRRVIRIPRAKRTAAMGLWVLAGAWCAHELTDGRIDHHEVEELGGRSVDATALVDAGLWTTTPTGYQFVDWDEHQAARDDVLADRAEKRDGGSYGNHQRWHAKRGRKVAGYRWCESVSVAPTDSDPDIGTESDTDRSTDSDPNRSTKSGANPPVPSRPVPLTDVTHSGHSSTDPNVREPDDMTDLILAKAKKAGIRDLAAMRSRLEEVLGRPVAARAAIELALGLAERSRQPVKDLDAYVARSCEKSPQDVSFHFGRLDLGDLA